MPAARRAPGHRQRLARGDPQLLAHDVDPGHELADRMLHLQPRVQLDEVEGPVRAEQELEGTGALVADRPAGALGGGLHLLPRRWIERGRRRLLDQLLVAPLDRALALAEREHAAQPVAEHLDLDVARRHERLLEVQRAVAEGGLGLGPGRRVRRLELAPAARRAACPCRRRPRRPSAGRGSRARRPPRARRRAPRRPRCRARAGTSAARISAFARALSPIRSITSAGGPTKTRSLSAQARTKSGFSERKP